MNDVTSPLCHPSGDNDDVIAETRCASQTKEVVDQMAQRKGFTAGRVDRSRCSERKNGRDEELRTPVRRRPGREGGTVHPSPGNGTVLVC